MATERELEKAIERGIMKAIFDMERFAKRICPVDTGRLRESIKVKIQGSTVTIGMYTDYAQYVEYGTKSMEEAHGRHDPENPVTSWEALKKRGGSGQMMPVIRPAIHMAIRRFLPERIRSELMKVK